MNRKFNGRCAILLLSATVILFGLANPTRAVAQQDAVTTDRKISLNQVVSTSCVDKEIRLDGDIQAQFRVKHDGSGSYIEADFNSEGIKGLGVTSGNRYEAAGTSHFDSGGASKLEFTYIITFVLNRAGTHESVMVHAKLGISIKAKDNPTVEVRNVDIDCNSESH